VVTVATMVFSTMLATAVTGGVLRRTVPALPGAATWVTTMAMLTGTTTVRQMVFPAVASGINLFYLFEEGSDTIPLRVSIAEVAE